MDENEVDSVLQAILLGMLIPDSSVEDARATLTMLLKIVSNCVDHPLDDKYKKLNVANPNIKRRIVDCPGASEFLDAIQFCRVEEEFLLLDDKQLSSGKRALEQALLTLPTSSSHSSSAFLKTSSSSSSTTTPIPSTISTSTADEEYLERRRLADLRMAEANKKLAKDREAKDKLKLAMKLEQKEVLTRPVQASHATAVRTASSQKPGGVLHANSDAEFQRALTQYEFVLANFTAAWCGPCQQVAPQVEAMCKVAPHVQLVKIDIDANSETPSRFQVSAVPTFILFKRGVPVGDQVKGANPTAIQHLIHRAV